MRSSDAFFAAVAAVRAALHDGHYGSGAESTGASAQRTGGRDMR
ncbi:hypothetical protein [Nocardia jejuensis]|nr:hypothetical protein [Nocardia jejuensis]